MDFTKIAKADLDSPCQELSNSGLRFFVALLVFWELIFVCFYRAINPAGRSFVILKAPLAIQNSSLNQWLVSLESGPILGF